MIQHTWTFLRHCRDEMQLGYCDRKLADLPPRPQEHASRHPLVNQFDLGKHWDKGLGRTVPI